MRTRSASTAASQAPSVAYNLAGIAVLVLLLAVGAAYLIDTLVRASAPAQPSLADGDAIRQTISGRELTIPASWFRYGEQVHDGFTDQIDLRVIFAPEGASKALPVDISLVPRSRVRASSTLLDAVYLHQFGDDTLTGVPDLVGKPLGNGQGYMGESVWYDALSPNPFVAKCAEPVEAGTPPRCLRTVYLGSGIAAIYAFDATILGSWRQFDAEMRRWLEPIGAWQNG